MPRLFEMPSDDQWESILGVAPIEGEELVRVIDLPVEEGLRVQLVTDRLGGSVSLSVARGATEFLRIFREGAVLLSLTARAPQILVHFETDDTTGKISIALDPLDIQETTLFA